MSYVDAFLDRKLDKIRISERINGKRHLKDVTPKYVLYYEDPSGTHKSIFGHNLKKITETSNRNFRAKLNEYTDVGKRIFESDINPVFRHIADHYANVDAPMLNLGFFDIEADFHAEKGFAPATDPFNAITAITLYRSADQKLLTFVLKPPTYSYDDAQDVVESFEDTLLFDDEGEMLKRFLDEIDDVDVLTSWNGSAYDIPYTVNRVSRILGKDETKRFCLWDQLPSEREYMNKFGRTVKTYDLVGRVHFDYLELYAKHNQQQRLSYALNAIGELVVGETKTQYEGSLDDLYKKDFPTFIEYNRQDVLLMVKIDKKLRYIELHNQIAHANGVVLKTTMGSVALIEQSIINHFHSRDLIVPNRKADVEEIEDLAIDDDDEDEDDWKKPDDGRTPVVGAYVAEAKKGLRKHVGCVDINSLYPSTIRSLNMSPETLVGQVRPDATMKLIKDRVAKLSRTKRAEAWEGIFSTLEVGYMQNKTDDVVTVDFFDFQDDTSDTVEMTGSQLHDFIFNPDNHVCITANGTIFRTDVEGVIPNLLAQWFSQRKEMQKKQKEFKKQAEKASDENEKKQLLEQSDFWNQRQQARKILLNSLYGALLNEYFRMYDERLGQSVTLTGRSIVRHMNATINQTIAGTYDYRGDAIVYADTDSCYFSAYEYAKGEINTGGMNKDEIEMMMESTDTVIELYDLIAETTNETFPEFMHTTFNTSPERGAIIRAGRELIGSSSLFIKKKKYAILMVEKEGTRYDKDGAAGELKIMGLDLKRSDTPKYMQKFLETLLYDLLTDKDRNEMYKDIKDFRKMFKTRPGWEKGSPKKVSNLSGYMNRVNISNKAIALDGRKSFVKNEKKFMIPNHVLGSMNWNKLCEIYHDKHAVPITDGSRIIVCKLAKNSLNMNAVAYPIDEPHVPQWFKDLPFDHAAMEETIIDKKIGNLVGVLNWDLTDTIEKAAEDLFSF